MAEHILGGAPAPAKPKSKSTNTVRNPDWRILEVICGLAASFGKSHCYPSQDKLLELIERFTGRVMSRRTLNRHLNALCAGQYLRRIRRHTKDKVHGYLLRSTCYVPMWRYCQRLARNAKTIFSLLGAQLKTCPTSRVTSMAQNMNKFFRSIITTAVDKSPKPS
jgi:hypothetical protein